MQDPISRLRASLSEFPHVSPGFLDELIVHVTQERFSKNQEISAKKMQEYSICFVAEGLFKACYFDELGKEIVTGFWWESGYWLTQPDNPTPIEHLLFLEDTLLLALPSDALGLLSTMFAEVDTLTKRIYALERIRLRQRADILHKGAADGYELFQRVYPAHRIKLQDIAHFMGIRPFTLSRIRGKS